MKNLNFRLIEFKIAVGKLNFIKSAFFDQGPNDCSL